MRSNRLIYIIGYPLVTFGLCAFAYYLGVERGRQAGPETQVLPESLSTPETTPAHTPAKDELTFFKTLKEGSPAPEKPLSNRLTEAPAEAQPTGGIVVQLSAFKDVGKAHELVSDLKNRGYPAFAESDRKAPGGWFRVYVGPFPSREKAESTLEELVSKGFSKGFVTELKRS